jgi:hypothetical protein
MRSVAASPLFSTDPGFIERLSEQEKGDQEQYVFCQEKNVLLISPAPARTASRASNDPSGISRSRVDRHAFRTGEGRSGERRLLIRKKMFS